MNKEEYQQLLKDGRWQRKRLEIMQRDDFRCTKCGTTNDLNVHHLRYLTGRKPWEYEDADLITLCGRCHKETHEQIEQENDYYKCACRARQLDGLFVYYKQIGELHDVITTCKVYADDYPALLDLFIYWRDVEPYYESWMFSEGAHCNGPTIGWAECRQVREYFWNNDPDAILTKEQFENVRQGFNYDKECLDEDEWNVINSYYFDYSEQIYSKL